MSTETTVGSTALHLMGDISDPVKETVMNSVLKKGDLAGLLILRAISGISSKMPAVFNYAKNQYTLDLPTGKSTLINNPTKEEIAAALADAIDYPLGVIVSKFIYTDMQPHFDMLDYFLEERKLDLFTNTVYKYPDLKFSNLQQLKITSSAISPDSSSIEMSYEYWGFLSYIETINDGDGTPIDYARQRWHHFSDHTEVVTRVNPNNTVYTGKCLIARYQKLNDLSEMLPDIYYWIYRLDTDIYPTLNNISVTPEIDEYFPVVPLRYNNQDLTGQDSIKLQEQLLSVTSQIADLEIARAATADNTPMWYQYTRKIYVLTALKAKLEFYLASAETVKASPLYATSKKLLNILNIPFLKLGDQINANPSLIDIDHAYVIFGADLQSENSATLAYLNHYFDYLSTLETTVYRTNVDPDANPYGYLNSVFTEHGLTLAIQFSAISTIYTPGKINKGQLGDARKTIQITKYPGVMIGDGAEGGGGYYVAPRTETKLILDLQVTASVLRQVTVDNLMTINLIAGETGIDTSLDMIKNDPSNHNLIIPLEYHTSLLLPPAQRNTLYNDCTLLVINSVVITKLKWYQEEWVTPVVMGIGFIVMVWSAQPWLMALGKAIEAGVAAVLTLLAITTALSLVINITMNFLVKKFGAKFGMLGTAILFVAAMVMRRYDIGIQLMAQYTLSTAQIILQCSTALISAVNEFIKAGTQRIIEEYTIFTNLLKDANDALDANTEVQTLDLRADFDPLIFTKAGRYYTVPNEDPNEFFRRTLGLCDNSFYGIHNAVPDFVTNLLTLDKNTVMSRSYIV